MGVMIQYGRIRWRVRGGGRAHLGDVGELVLTDAGGVGVDGVGDLLRGRSCVCENEFKGEVSMHAFLCTYDKAREKLYLRSRC